MQSDTDRFEVPVCVALFMDVRHGTDNLTETDASFVLRQTIFSDNVVKQFTTGTVLHSTTQHNTHTPGLCAYLTRTNSNDFSSLTTLQHNAYWAEQHA